MNGTAPVSGARVAGYLGRVLDADGEPAGTCFQVAPGVLVTAWHVLEEIGAAGEDAEVSVDPLAGGARFSARVKRQDQAHDLAVMTAPTAWPAAAGSVTRASRLPLGTQVTVTGHAELDDPGHDYRYLSAPGTWAGDTIRDATVELGSMTAPRVLRGMSGAPVVRADGVVVGVVSGRYNSADGWLAGNVWVARGEDLLPLLAGIADVTLVEDSAPSPTWSYLERVVRHIAPEGRLLGRDREIEEMTAFCEGREPYLWWQADAWAGKSALMASFVLDPPRGVDVVSFFITARDASQATSEAFMTVLVSQLEEFLDRDLPGPEVDDGLAGRYEQLLHAAAHQARTQGKRLVLVVDGLDEDRGTQSNLPSIASLLPGRSGSLRVIVSSRPTPGLPPDVPADHPLRTAPFRVLSRSAHAEMIRAGAEAELQELLGGTRVQQDLLGLLTAARGGLAIPDLAELTGAEPEEICQVFEGVTGRTFGTRSADSPLAEVPDQVYLLAHDVLQVEAAAGLGERRLTGYRERLNSWADRYRLKGWPTGTPVYLLSGYFAMLQAAGDDARLIGCAQDPARHDRMLAVSGGDSTGLAEITAAMSRVLAQDDPDLAAMTRLAVHQDTLTSRNRYLPAELPAVWVAVGQLGRAEALARSDIRDRTQALENVAAALAGAGHDDRAEILAASIAEPYQRALVLAATARALAAAGKPHRAGEVADQAETVAGTLTDSHQHAIAQAKVAAALVGAGQYDRAEALVGALTDPSPRGAAVAIVAEALVAARQYDRAEVLAHSAAGRNGAVALATLAQGLTKARRYDRAAAVAERAEAASCGADSLYGRPISPRARIAETLAELAEALLADGQRDRATAIGGQAETVARSLSILEKDKQAAVFFRVAEVLRAVGKRRRADALTGSISDPGLLALAEVRAIAGVLSGSPGPQGLAAGHARAEALARSITRGDHQTAALTALAAALTTAGQYARAEAVADIIADPDKHAEALATLAQALTEARQYDRAAVVADRAEVAARIAATLPERAQFLATLAKALMAAGLADHAATAADHAAALARHAEILSRHSGFDRGVTQMLVSVVEALMATGRHEQGAATAGAIVDPDTRERAVVKVAEGLAAARHYDDAEAIARSIGDPGTSEYSYQRSKALAQVAQAMVAAGRYDRAEALARAGSGRANAGYQQLELLIGVAEALAAAGQGGRAEALTRSIADRDLAYHGESLTKAAKALAAAGQPDRAVALAHRAETAARFLTARDRKAKSLIWAAEAMAAAGQYGPAAVAARNAEVLIRSMAVSTWQAEQLPALASAVARFLMTKNRVDGPVFTKPDDQAATFAAVAAGLSAARQYDRAENLASSINDSYYRARAFATLAQALVTGGRYDRAEAVTGLATGATEQTEALTTLTEALIAAGQPARAAAAARRAETASERAVGGAITQETHVKVVAALAAVALYDRAESRARAITSPVEQPKALAALAEALVTAGQYDRAETVSRSITRPSEQAKALTTLARALDSVGQPRPKLLASAVAAHWLTPLEMQALPPKALVAASTLLIAGDAPKDSGRGRVH